ncbi:AraC family transcriptional regulator [Alkalihalobacterium alkalinitrilicum]|uniref:AraC family transcriptional regulator n=1 Tax=Alkalihalobacterium alkalinitrilicum TaxID=427920 RepID=UPI001EE45F76|nr:AraC family transcriptional regulator [Alkalihalobacterium alkalinitrilicum]
MTVTYLRLLDAINVSLLTIKGESSSVLNECNNEYILLYVASGSGQLSSKQGCVYIKEGESYWIKEKSMLTSSSEKFLSAYRIAWIIDDSNYSWLSELSSAQLAYQPPTKMVPLYHDILLLQKEMSVSQKCRFMSELWNVLSLLTEDSQEGDIESVISFICDNPSESVSYSVEELATKARMAPSSFTRAFSKKVGMSPKEFLNEERIKLAKKLMIQHKGINIKDVTQHIGLQDEFYFSRFFKKKVGIPPSIFMKRSHNRVAVVSQLFLQDHLLSLGIQPVAAPAYPNFFPSTNGLPSYLAGELEGSILLNAENRFELEEVLNTMPDYIIKTQLHQGEEQSVLWSHNALVHSLSLKSSWDEYLWEIATLLNKKDRVETIVEEINQLESQVRNILTPITKKRGWALLWIRSNEIRLYGYNNRACLDLFYQKLGFEPHPNVPKVGTQVVTIEELATINPDRLFIIWSKEEDVLKVTKSKEWKYLKAVQNEEVYYPNSLNWEPSGPLGRKYMLQGLVSFFNQCKC